MSKKYTLDMEWQIEKPQTFRCAALTDGKGKVTTFDSLSEFTKALSKLPKGAVIGGHYVVSDIGMLVKWGQAWCLPKDLTLDDSLTASRLLYGHLPAKDLKTMSAEFGMRYENRQKQQTGSITEEDLEYCAKDAWSSHYLTPLLTKGITKQTQEVLDTNNAFQKAFLAVELAGLRFDVKKAAVEESRLTEVLSWCVTQLPEGLSPSVAKDDNEMRAWLMANYREDELKYFERTKKTKELSVGVKYMRLLERQPAGFGALLEARHTQDFLSLYVQGKQRFLDENQFLYPSYKLLVAKTHRRSTEPSIQNWPKEAREFITSRWPQGEIVWGDFKQLEARLFAWQCKSKQLMTDLLEGGYIGIGSRVFGITVEKGSAEYKLIKAIVLATQYNMGAGKLRSGLHINNGLKITYRKAEEMLDRFFNTYPEVAIEAERRRAYAWKTGTAWSDVGAPVPLYLLPASHYPPESEWELDRQGNPIKPWPIKQIENFSINYPTQQLAGYVTGCALLAMQEALAEECGGWGEYLSQIHDSTKLSASTLHTVPVLEVHDEIGCDSQDIGRTLEFMPYCMTTGMLPYLKKLCPYFDCPLAVDMEHMPYWSKT